MSQRPSTGTIIGAFVVAPIGGFCVAAVAVAALVLLAGVDAPGNTVRGALLFAELSVLVGTPVAWAVQGLLLLIFGAIPPAGGRGILLTGALGGGTGILVMLLGCAVLDPAQPMSARAWLALYGGTLGAVSGLLYASMLAPPRAVQPTTDVA